MCKRCKTCGESNLGVKITEIKSIAARMLNGEIVETFDQSLESKQTQEVTYCFTCNKEISEADLVDTVICTSCGKEVDGSDVEDGLCPECVKAKREAELKAQAIANMSQEELVKLLMSGQLNIPAQPVVAQAKEEMQAKKEAEVKEPVKEVVTADLKPTDAAKETEKVEEVKNDASNTVEDKVKEKVKEKVTTKKEKPAPAEITEEGINKAEETIKEKVVATETPASITDESKVEEEEFNVELDPNAVDIPQGEISEEDILAKLDNIDLDF